MFTHFYVKNRITDNLQCWMQDQVHNDMAMAPLFSRIKLGSDLARILFDSSRGHVVRLKANIIHLSQTSISLA